MIGLVIVLVFNTANLFGDEAGISEKKIFFQNGSYIVQVTKNTLVSPAAPDDSSQIMKVHGKLLLVNGVDTAVNFKPVQEFMETCVGMISAFASNELPPGWLPCDGIEYDPKTNCELQALADKIRNNWGGTTAADINGHYAGTFKVPDLRGLFLRGADYMSASKGAAGNDPGPRYSDVDTYGTLSGTNDLGKYQKHGFTAHGDSHILTTNGGITGSGTLGAHKHNGTRWNAASHFDSDGDFEEFGYARETLPADRSQYQDGTLEAIGHTHSLTYIGTIASSDIAAGSVIDTSSHPKYKTVIYGIRF